MGDVKRYKTRVIAANKKQINFNIDNDLPEKIKNIAHAEGKDSASEIYNLAIRNFVDKYEKKYGKVKPRPKGKNLSNL